MALPEAPREVELPERYTILFDKFYYPYNWWSIYLQWNSFNNDRYTEYKMPYHMHWENTRCIFIWILKIATKSIRHFLHPDPSLLFHVRGSFWFNLSFSLVMRPRSFYCSVSRSVIMCAHRMRFDCFCIIQAIFLPTECWQNENEQRFTKSTQYTRSHMVRRNRRTKRSVLARRKPIENENPKDALTHTHTDKKHIIEHWRIKK